MCLYHGESWDDVGKRGKTWEIVEIVAFVDLGTPMGVKIHVLGTPMGVYRSRNSNGCLIHVLGTPMGVYGFSGF